MRSIGKIDHPLLNITVFANDGRFPVQFELRGLTQIYRFRQGDRLRHLGDIQRLIDAPFLEAVVRQFREMETLRAGLLRSDAAAGDATDDLPDII